MNTQIRITDIKRPDKRTDAIVTFEIYGLSNTSQPLITQLTIQSYNLSISQIAEKAKADMHRRLELCLCSLSGTALDQWE